MPVIREPSELSEQIKLCARLDRAGILFFAVPNGGRRSRAEAISLRSSGVKRGVPDLIIPEPPGDGVVGAVVEMKRTGSTRGDVRSEQREWLQAFEELGWIAVVGYGADDATIKLRAAGYAL